MAVYRKGQDQFKLREDAREQKTAEEAAYYTQDITDKVASGELGAGYALQGATVSDLNKYADSLGHTPVSGSYLARGKGKRVANAQLS